jgi:hypothetical protein
MDAVRRRAVRLISAAVFGAAIAVPTFVVPSTVNHVAICPNGMVSNPAGYGCVPDRPGVGAPSEEVLTRCNGNYYICVWPYPVP